MGGSSGGQPQYPPERYVSLVDDRIDERGRWSLTGVPAKVIGEELGIRPDTALKHLHRLVEDGRLKRTKGLGVEGHLRYGFLPADDDAPASRSGDI